MDISWNYTIGALNKTGLDYFTVYFCQSGLYKHSSVHTFEKMKKINLKFDIRW